METSVGEDNADNEELTILRNTLQDLDSRVKHLTSLVSQFLFLMFMI